MVTVIGSFFLLQLFKTPASLADEDSVSCYQKQLLETWPPLYDVWSLKFVSFKVKEKLYVEQR